MGLIDDLVQGISKGVSEIQARSQQMIAIYNLNQEIRELEQQKIAKLANIGRLMYDQYEQQITANEESLQQLCKEITALGKDISQLQTKVDNLKAQSNSNTSA